MRKNIKAKYNFIITKMESLSKGDIFWSLSDVWAIENCQHCYEVCNIQFDNILGKEKKIYIEAKVLNEERHIFNCGHKKGERYSFWNFNNKVLTIKNDLV